MNSLLELLLAGIAYSSVYFLSPGESYILDALVPALTFWVQYKVRGVSGNPWFVAVDGFLVGAGFNLLVQAVLSYFFILQGVPLFLIGWGTAAAATLVAISQAWLPSGLRSRSRYLILGSGSTTLSVVRALPPGAVIGIVARDASYTPEDLPFLGTFEEIDRVIREYRPRNIVVTMPVAVPPRKLLELRWSGIQFHDATELYEQKLARICVDHIRPRHLFFQDSLFPFRPAMAIQAIYTNLIGLAALILVSPILALFGVLSLLFSGPGPMFDYIECLGFYHIPFNRLRFRARDIRTGNLTVLGRCMNRLRILDLPLLLNVVRGELALIGPKSVRIEYAARLTQLIPLHFRRFAIKPGLIGWAEVHRHADGSPMSEIERLEYDLYYLKNTSPTLDGEILLRLLLAPIGRVLSRLAFRIGFRRNMERLPSTSRARP